VLSETLAQSGSRSGRQCVRDDSHDAETLSAFMANLPGFEEEVDPATRPFAKVPQIRERSRPAEARAQPIDEGLEALEIGETAHAHFGHPAQLLASREVRHRHENRYAEPLKRLD